MGLFGNRDWNYLGFNKKTKSYYDEKGFDKQGYDKKGYDKKGYNLAGFHKDGIHKKTKTKFNEEGFNKKGYNEIGYNERGYDKKGFNKDGIHATTKTKFDTTGFNKEGINLEGFGKNCIHKKTKTKFNEIGFDIQGYDKKGYDKEGYDKEGYDKEGLNFSGFLKFEITSVFDETISKFDSDFSAVIGLAYNEPTKMKSKLFFSHDKKMGIYSKEFESFSNKNVVHIHIEKARKQSNANWIKPKDTGNKQGDNFEPGYTLIVNFNKNDTALKKFVIDELNKLKFGSLTSGHTLHCHLDEDFPTDERAKELLQKAVELFNLENYAES